MWMMTLYRLSYDLRRTELAGHMLVQACELWGGIIACKRDCIHDCNAGITKVGTIYIAEQGKFCRPMNTLQTYDVIHSFTCNIHYEVSQSYNFVLDLVIN